MKKLIPILLLVLLSIGCVVGSVPGIPAIYSFSANPSNISPGESATLSWNVSGAAAVFIDQGVGSVALTGDRTVTPNTTTVYTLTATNAVGMSATATVQVIVTGAPPPPVPAVLPIINTFTANPPTISTGGTSILNWNVSNAATVTINPGAGSVSHIGTTSVSPGSTTNYTVTASNAAGSASQSITVIVSGPVVIFIPDLSITTGSPTVTPSTVFSGGSVTLSAWTVKNIGTAASGSFSNGFYLSTDSVISAADIYLTGNSNTNLVPGAQFDWGGPTLTIPDGTPPGNYYIGILVDRNNSIGESNENNNYVSRQITVSGPIFIFQADLVITTGSPTVSPSTVAAGGTVTLSAWTVKNQGAVSTVSPFSNGFYLSTDPVITATDTYLTGNSNTNLVSDAQFNWGGPTLTIPIGTPPGTYYIGILVDRNNSIAESNENNNYVSRQITVN